VLYICFDSLVIFKIQLLYFLVKKGIFIWTYPLTREFQTKMQHPFLISVIFSPNELYSTIFITDIMWRISCYYFPTQRCFKVLGSFIYHVVRLYTHIVLACVNYNLTTLITRQMYQLFVQRSNSGWEISCGVVLLYVLYCDVIVIICILCQYQLSDDQTDYQFPICNTK
jgi:hypothetical protein